MRIHREKTGRAARKFLLIKRARTLYDKRLIMQTPPRTIHVSISEQTLELREGERLLRAFPVSTSAAGVGSEPGSMRTPLGRFEIAEKIGHDAPHGMVFKSRLPTGEIGTEDHPDDLVQTRILWLHGLEEHNANTRERYIYIHGTNHESQLGTPASHGCIRMSNADVAELFDAVESGTAVFIQP
jgi:lipoprotein-anchoring transpeptidase ErfK/SrfK